MEEEISGEIEFLDTLLKRNNREISVWVYRGPTHTDQYLRYSSHHQASCKESVVSFLFNKAYSIISNKDNLHKENARIKQMLKENGYKESIIGKIFKRITNNHSLPQWKQLTQATNIQEEEIRMSINLPYIEGTTEKLWHKFRYLKTRAAFYNENILCNIFCKPKDRVATEDKNNIAYETDCSNVKQSTLMTLNGLWNCVQMNTKDLPGFVTVIRMKLQNTVGNQITTLAGIRRNLLIGKAGQFLGRSKKLCIL